MAKKLGGGKTAPPPYLRVWMTTPPPHLKVWICHCHQHYHYHDHPSINLVTNAHDQPWSSLIRLFAFIMVISFTFISSMILVKQAVFPVPGAPEMYKLPGFPFGRWLCRNDLISVISFSRHSKLSGCEECSALLTLEYWWPLKIRVSDLLWCQFYFNNIILENARFLDESLAEEEENKTIIELNQNDSIVIGSFSLFCLPIQTRRKEGVESQTYSCYSDSIMHANPSWV